MYLVPIQVPIYRAGDQNLVTTEWRRSLLLLRDSLMGQFGPLVVAAPSLPAESVTSDQNLEPMSGDEDIRLLPSFDARVRARAFWLKWKRVWLDLISPLIAEADVVHSGLYDIYRPICYSGFRVARRLGRPTVFVQDTDIALQVREMAGAAPIRKRPRMLAYASIYERIVRRGVADADLSLLKGRALIEHYGRGARNARQFENTSYLSHEIVARGVVDARVASLQEDRPLRLVYCGRLLPRKGLADGLAMLGAARARGARITFDVIGAGPQLAELQSRVQSLGLGGSVRFLGAMPYGPELLRRLAEYDALFFTPPVEDTPRMIFDGYAAGLPLISTDIAYTRERAQEDGAAILLPREHPEVGPRVLAELELRRRPLAGLASRAYEAAQFHAADRWYARRAEWTFEIADRRRARDRAAVMT